MIRPAHHIAQSALKHHPFFHGPLHRAHRISSPALGQLIGIPGHRNWRVAKFPLLCCCFERGDQPDVVRLPGERQDRAAILGGESASS